MSGIRGENSPSAEEARYLKFKFHDTSYIPNIGNLDYQPKNGAMRLFDEGEFSGEHLIEFGAIKRKQYLNKLGVCGYCRRTHDSDGNKLKLTSEHIIPEALGAGIEVPDASCDECQKATSEYESSVVAEIFDPVRRNLLLSGKQGVLKNKHFEVDIGGEVTDKVFIAEDSHPTIMCLPQLFPASLYSSRPYNTNGFFNLMLYNLNFRKEMLDRYDIESFCTQAVDMARFCQMIAKIAHMSCVSTYGIESFSPIVGDFARRRIAPKTPSSDHFNAVGKLWRYKDKKTKNLHEVEAGKIKWQSNILFAARVRLFSSYGMPSYFVAVGR